MSKIVKAVTDNGSNFVKAFKEYGIQGTEDTEDCDIIEDDEIEEDDGDMLMLEECLTQTDELQEDQVIVLPAHQRCASHTLSLVCTVDANSKSSRLQKSAFAKCYGVWNKSARSTKFAETVKSTCGVYFKKPCVTRWNSLYDSLRGILKQKDQINLICTELGVPLFHEREIEFIEQYCDCVKPIAEALDRLQGENNTFYGELIPTLLTIEKRLNMQINLKPKHCESLPQTLLNGIRRRFHDFLNLSPEVKDAILASISYPKMKLRWVSLEKLEDMKALFIEKALLEFGSQVQLECSEVSSNVVPLEDDQFFLFEDAAGTSSGHETHVISVQQECLDYLKDPVHDIQILRKYPTVMKMFMKYNTPLPSSGAVERLFSYSSMVLSPKRKSTSDNNFEKLTLLKVNNY
jgi:hypothetical protein